MHLKKQHDERCKQKDADVPGENQPSESSQQSTGRFVVAYPRWLSEEPAHHASIRCQPGANPGPVSNLLGSPEHPEGTFVSLPCFSVEVVLPPYESVEREESWKQRGCDQHD